MAVIVDGLQGPLIETQLTEEVRGSAMLVLTHRTAEGALVTVVPPYCRDLERIDGLLLIRVKWV